MRPKMNAPTGRNASVSVIESAIAASDFPNSRAIAVRVITTRKKSNASSVQPRNPATTAARWSAAAGRTAVIGVLPEDPLDYTHDRRSEEHTSELQSHLNLVCRLLLEKKNKIRDIDFTRTTLKHT